MSRLRCFSRPELCYWSFSMALFRVSRQRQQTSEEHSELRWAAWVFQSIPNNKCSKTDYCMNEDFKYNKYNLNCGIVLYVKVHDVCFVSKAMSGNAFISVTPGEQDWAFGTFFIFPSRDYGGFGWAGEWSSAAVGPASQSWVCASGESSVWDAGHEQDFH